MKEEILKIIDKLIGECKESHDKSLSFYASAQLAILTEMRDEVSRVELPVMPNEVIAGGSKRWKPKEKEIFYYVNFYTGVTEQIYTNSKIHTPRNLYKIGNCYKTKEEAQIKWNQIKKILLQR